VSPADIVSAGIAVGVRVERVVVLPGGDPVRLAVLAAGGEREGNTESYVGYDRDGVEWRVAVVSGSGLSVMAPSTPGAKLTEQARFVHSEDAREYAARIRERRRDLRSDEIRIGDPRVIEYAGPTR
jgi:hypothetical protein